jgi:lipopolysaccharide/colanic/teichoic acid biosynthesis glycosyltransferase
MWFNLDSWATWWALSAVSSSAAVHYIIGLAVAQKGKEQRVAVIKGRDRANDTSRIISEINISRTAVSYYDDQNLSSLVSSAKQGVFEIVLLAMASTDPLRISRICELFADVPIRICVAIDPTGLGGPAQRGRFLLLDLAAPPPGARVSFLKRVVDILGSSVGLALCLPVLAIAMLAIRFETGRPVIFRQWRSGQAGRPFEVLKLRTMHLQGYDPSGERQTSPHDPRVTRVGRLLRRTSIDELPQLVNVLRGEMPLVGPRAHPIHMKIEGRDFAEVVKNYQVRHRIRPGLTGWAQVNGSRGFIDEIASAFC